MTKNSCTIAVAEAANARFEKEVYRFLAKWLQKNGSAALLRFGRPPQAYLTGDALRDLFRSMQHPVQALLQKRPILRHLGRSVKSVHFEQVSGDPLLSATEQRIYNLARRMDNEQVRIPFRSIHPFKQAEAGDNADISTYPAGSEAIRYNSGNHFTSRPANENVFKENSRRCLAKARGNLHVFFQRGYLEDRLQDVKLLTAAMQQAGRTQELIFVICSRHSAQEGHYSVSLVVMSPENPHFPVRVLVCDTLLKDLPHHPRWWPHFVTAYSNVFGTAIIELLEDISHPLQKVNIKGDDPYRHDWDCPYYAAAMAEALIDLAGRDGALVMNAHLKDLHAAMKALMPAYYRPDGQVRDREAIREVNKIKRWNSGRELIKALAVRPAHDPVLVEPFTYRSKPSP